MRIAFTSLVFILTTNFSFCQKIYPLPAPLNNGLISETNPSLTANGRTMILESDTGPNDSREIVISYQRAGRWTRPEPVPNLNSNSQAYTGGQFLSHDGKSIVFASNRYGGVGNKDIWFMEQNGDGTWAAPVNPGKPLNTQENEGDPTLSPDGKLLYMVKYNKGKGPQGQECGTIYVSERRGKNNWSEPTPLPSNINTGCECNPRILSDNKTLTFASIRKDGKGGFDQYVTKKNDQGKWSEPLPMDFINTEKDDLYISIPAGGEFVYFTGEAKKGTDIVRAMIPDHLKPDKVLLIEGFIKDEDNKAVNARLVITDLKKKTLTVYDNNNDGSYALIIPKGELLDLGIQGNKAGYLFSSTVLDTDTLVAFKEQKLDFTLQKVMPHKEYPMNLIFDIEKEQFSESSILEMDRVVRLINTYSENNFELTEYRYITKQEDEDNEGEDEETDEETEEVETVPTVEGIKILEEYLSTKIKNKTKLRYIVKEISMDEEKSNSYTLKKIK